MSIDFESDVDQIGGKKKKKKPREREESHRTSKLMTPQTNRVNRGMLFGVLSFAQLKLVKRQEKMDPFT